MTEEKLKLTKDMLRRLAAPKMVPLQIAALILFIVGIFIQGSIVTVLVINCLAWFLLGRAGGFVKGAMSSVDLMAERMPTPEEEQKKKLDKLYGRGSNENH